MSNANDFIIENGVLTKYVGPGGDVVIPEGVTKIGSAAFQYCETLRMVSMPDSVCEIEEEAFYYCKNLQKLCFGSGLFRELVYYMSERIGYEMTQKYGSRWWNEVLTALEYPRDLPRDGDYGDLLDSLDVANCLRLIERKWWDVFDSVLHRNCRTWAKELMGVRNEIAHIGQQDYPQEKAERALNTMLLLIREVDEEGIEAIEECYREVRARAGDAGPVVVEYVGLAQPTGIRQIEGNLLDLVGTEFVERTALTRKVTYGGKTVPYPVYKVRLDKLYYNDQNDRIATWISKFEAENGREALQEMSVEDYNRTIEAFIFDSNPESIRKTQNNIAMIGQREPGVVLADGRVVDGNRRFTCLRRLQRESAEPLYFETVIMEMDIREDRKQIKLLELAVQHGEEKKVEYDLIDYAVGTYRDIVQTGLLTIQEYAEGANEPFADVKKRIEIAEIICEFLDYLKLSGQYHAAREYQVYSLFEEMMTPLKKLEGENKAVLKTIAFNNAMLKAMPDQRKFIRDIKNLVKNDGYKAYFEDHKVINEEIAAKFAEAAVSSKADVDAFAAENKIFAQRMSAAMEAAKNRALSAVMRNKPSETVRKSIVQLSDLDARLFARLDPDEKETLKAELDELATIVAQFRRLLS